MRARLAAILSLVVLLGCVSEAHLPYQPATINYDNPVLLRVPNHELVWAGVVDVISDYFRIEREDPVRLLGGTLTEGRIDTFPKPGATLLEPWDHDSADTYERLESTLQSNRRYAVVKVIPAQNGGFWVDVAVYKELENVRQPEHATAGSATYRNDIAPPRSSLSLPSNADSNQPARVANQSLVNPDPNAALGANQPVAGPTPSPVPAPNQPARIPNQPFVNPDPNAGLSSKQPTGIGQSWIPQGRDRVAEQRILGQILDRFTPEGKPLPVN